MSILLESDVGRATPTRLFVAGAVALLLGVLGVGAVVAKADDLTGRDRERHFIEGPVSLGVTLGAALDAQHAYRPSHLQS